MDEQVPKPSVLDDLLGVCSTSIDVDPSSVNGETELDACMQVHQVSDDPDPPMWETAPERVPTRDPHDHRLPDCACQLCVS